MPDLTVTAVGKDRPGIVAAAARTFYELGCNLADCSMTRLSDQFAMILLVQAPDAVGREVLESALKEASKELALDFQVLEGSHEQNPPAGRPFVISLYGADHPGIVYRVASRLASDGVNITDLVSRVVGDNVFTMVLEVDLPASLDEKALEADLNGVAGDLDVNITLRPAEPAAL